MTTSRQRGMVSACIISASLAMAANVATAGTILQPAAATTNMGFFSTFDPVYAVDQSALTAAYTSGVTDFDTFVATTVTVSGGSSFTTWFSAPGNITGNFDFDLGGLLRYRVIRSMG